MRPYWHEVEKDKLHVSGMFCIQKSVRGTDVLSVEIRGRTILRLEFDSLEEAKNYVHDLISLPRQLSNTLQEIQVFASNKKYQ